MHLITALRTAAGLILLGTGCSAGPGGKASRSPFVAADSLRDERRFAAAHPHYRRLRDSFAIAQDTAGWWRAQLWWAQTLMRQGRTNEAETQLRAAAFRIQQLLDLVKAGAGAEDAEVVLPATWAEFAEWCDTTFAGRLTLSSAARRGVRQPKFDDLALAARCVLWLATTYRDGRLNGALSDFRDHYLEEGIKNSPCGGDEFDFDWQGRRYSADWHIKNGGNTRAPERALRLYYCWDEETRQVIVADMPAHRTSAVS